MLAWSSLRIDPAAARFRPQTFAAQRACLRLVLPLSAWRHLRPLKAIDYSRKDLFVLQDCEDVRLEGVTIRNWSAVKPSS